MTSPSGPTINSRRVQDTITRGLTEIDSPDTARTPGLAPIDPLRPKKSRRWKQRLVTHVALLLICSGFLLPFLWMLSTSLKQLPDTQAFPPTFIPHHVDMLTTHGVTTPIPQNYADVLTSTKFDFLRFASNSITVAGLSVLGTLLSSSIVAYGFARIKFKGRPLLFGIMLSTMMIPFPVLMVPLFTIFRFIGDHTPFQMIGTLRPLWIGAFFGNAFNIFLLRQFFLTIPEDLSEAARIDGCSEFGIFVRIILPLARPALMVVALFTFLASWNDFLGPLVYIQRPDQYTLALGLQAFQSQHGGAAWNQLMAASVLIAAPAIVLYFAMQKTFVEGIATTGLKG